MDITKFDPATLLYIIPGILALFFIARDLMRSSGPAEFTSKLFSFKKGENVNAIKQQLEELSKEVAGLRAEIEYRNAKEDLKYEFRNRLHKIVKKYSMQLTNLLEQQMCEVSGYNSATVRTTDEYRLLISTVDRLSYYITRKGMDDFDKNGFNKVGLNPEGSFDYRLQVQYINSKPEEYILEIRKTVEVEERPVTVPVDYGPSLRKVYVGNDQVVKSSLEVFDEVQKDVVEMYDFVVTGYRSIHEECLGAKCEEKSADPVAKH